MCRKRFIFFAVVFLPTILFHIAYASSSIKPLKVIKPAHVPVGFAIFSPIDSNFENVPTVHNFDFNLLYGKWYSLKGAAISVGVGLWKGNVTGAVVSIAGNVTEGKMVGAQISDIYNYAKDLYGAQISVLNRAADVHLGAEIGILNTSGKVNGYQDGVVNVSGNLKGADTGIVNTSADVIGAQIGIVNLAKNVTGMQYGLVNIAKSNKFGQIGILNIATNNAFNIYTGSGNDADAEIGMQSRSGHFFGIVAEAVRPHYDTRFGPAVSTVLGTGLQARYHRLTGYIEGRDESLFQDDPPLSLNIGATTPAWRRFLLFAQGGPSFSSGFTFQKYEFLVGLQFILKKSSSN